MRIITLFNLKGGVAKTTSAVNLGAALAKLGKKCLLIDLDPQGDLSESTGYGKPPEKAITSYEVLKGSNINLGIKQGLYDVLPADSRLSAAELELVDAKRRNYLLKDAIGALDAEYDYIIIDPQASLNIITIMALTASTEVIIPVQAQYLPLKGVAYLRDTINIVRARFNKALEIGGIILTFYHSTYSLDNDVLEALEQAFPNKVFKTKISNNTKVAQAPSHGKDIFAYSPKSNGAKQYLELAGEVIEQETTRER